MLSRLLCALGIHRHPHSKQGFYHLCTRGCGHRHTRKGYNYGEN